MIGSTQWSSSDNELSPQNGAWTYGSNRPSDLNPHVFSTALSGGVPPHPALPEVQVCRSDDVSPALFSGGPFPLGRKPPRADRLPHGLRAHAQPLRGVCQRDEPCGDAPIVRQAPRDGDRPPSPHIA